jgi:hypothetical protein
MPMYVQLLQAVLSNEVDPASPVQTPAHSPGPLAQLIRLRHVMDKHAEHNDPGWALQSVTDQLAYDAALVRLCRRRGVPVELDSFDVPKRGRAQLEQALLDKGVNLPTRSGTGADTAYDDR